MSVACHCGSCQRAAAKLMGLGAPSTLDEDQGAPLVLVRKDRLRVVSGYDKLREYRLSPKSPTRRAVASCCNTPLFISPPTPWLSFFHLCLDAAPPLTMRANYTAEAPPRDGLPASRAISPRGAWRIFCAFAAMRFRNPKLPPIQEERYPD